MYTYNDYIEGVQSGSISTGELVKLAVRRHMADLERQRTDGFPYFFDESEGRRWIDFAAKCRHWRGKMARQPIILEPWQQFYFMMQFGWRRVGGGRRFRNSYLEIARKNGKTTMCALKCIGHLILDREEGAQAYIAATKEDQARIGFRDVQEIIKVTPGLSEIFKSYTKSVVKGNSFIKPLGSDSNTQDGMDPSFGIIDEYHAHTTSGMLNVLRTGMGVRQSPMIDIITTAGFNKQNPCFTETRKACISILRGILNDESQFALIFTIDEQDDWNDPAVWVKSNPNHHALDPAYLSDMHRKAINEGGSMEVEFKTKNLNIWTDVQDTWLPDDEWNACNLNKIDLADLTGRTCWAGLDLASVRDYTALALFFPGDPISDVVMLFWIPADRLKLRIDKDNVNVRQWVKDGWIIETPGNTTDYDFVRRKIGDLSAEFTIERLAYDRNNSSQLIIGLQSDGVNCVPYAQTATAMNPGCMMLEKMIAERSVNHGGNPVLRWMNSNVLIMRDSSGNMKIDRKDRSLKVDGMVALTMALGNFIASGGIQEEQTYEIVSL